MHLLCTLAFYVANLVSPAAIICLITLCRQNPLRDFNFIHILKSPHKYWKLFLLFFMTLETYVGMLADSVHHYTQNRNIVMSRLAKCFYLSPQQMEKRVPTSRYQAFSRATIF